MADGSLVNHKKSEKYWTYKKLRQKGRDLKKMFRSGTSLTKKLPCPGVTAHPAISKGKKGRKRE